jgi:hypothetical protein
MYKRIILKDNLNQKKTHSNCANVVTDLIANKENIIVYDLKRIASFSKSFSCKAGTKLKLNEAGNKDLTGKFVYIPAKHIITEK